MKKALIVSNPFLPDDSPGVRRSISFISLLRNYGWEPVVLTREARAVDVSGEPDGLDLPDGMEIYRTNPWELDELPGMLGLVGKHIAERLLVPDRKRLWEMSSHRKAARIVKNDGIDLIFTTSPNKSSHLLGLYLKKRFPQIPWIADLCPELSINTGKPGVENKTDHRIGEMADCIVINTEAGLNALFERHSGRSMEERCFIIPDGFIEELSGVFEKSCRLIAAKRLVQ